MLKQTASDKSSISEVAVFTRKIESVFFLSFETISQNVHVDHLLLADIVRKVGFGMAIKRLFLA